MNNPANPAILSAIMLFTPERARECNAKALEARRRNKIKREMAITAALEQRPVTPQNPLIDDFITKRLLRVRKQLDSIDSEIRKELDKDAPDGQQLNWLCTAQERLAEQERLLAGRPMPGSLKPKASSTKGPSLAQQSDPEPIGPQ